MFKKIRSILIITVLLFTNLMVYHGHIKCQNKDKKEFSKEYPNATFIPDIIYGKGGEKDLKLDLYLPKAGTPPYISIVFIHGGGWSNLSKEYLSEWGYYFADIGYVAVSIDYRLSGEAKFPAAVEDCKCAVRWMRANAQKYNINPDKIALFGESAGGHLAALVGTSGGIKELEGSGGYNDYSSSVNLVFPVYGMFDIVGSGKQRQGKGKGGSLEKFIGGSFNKIPGKYKMASPLTYIDKEDPPFLIFHSTGDKVVPYQQSVILEEKLKESGVTVSLSTTYGGEHGYVLHPPYFKATCKQMEDFIRDYLK